jgi:hypothetical protein
MRYLRIMTAAHPVAAALLLALPGGAATPDRPSSRWQPASPEVPPVCTPWNPAPAAWPARSVAVSIARPLPFLYDLYTFRGDAGTLVVAAYAVEAGELEREHVGGGVRYRFDVSLVLNDTNLRSVLSRHDSVYVDVPRPLTREHLLFTTVELESRPSVTMLQRVYMYNATAPGIGQFYSTPFTVPDYSGRDLMLSDIVLGQPDTDGGWRRGDLAVAILPGRQFRGSAFDVYYEIYNLKRGSAYRTEIRIERLNVDGAVAGAPLVRLSFGGEARAGAGGAVQELRRVESLLPRGRYLMTITVTDTAGRRSASRERAFEVHSSRAGATMVPALPVTGSRPPDAVPGRRGSG